MTVESDKMWCKKGTLQYYNKEHHEICLCNNKPDRGGCFMYAVYRPSLLFYVNIEMLPI